MAKITFFVTSLTRATPVCFEPGSSFNLIGSVCSIDSPFRIIVKGNLRSTAAFPLDRSIRALPGPTGLQGILFVSITKTCCMISFCPLPGHPCGVMFASPMTESFQLALQCRLYGDFPLSPYPPGKLWILARISFVHYVPVVAPSRLTAPGFGWSTRACDVLQSPSIAARLGWRS